MSVNVSVLNPSEAGVECKQITMSLEDWISVPDNRRQRNTEARAGRAFHLYRHSLTHQTVSMAILPSGQKYKLDGHTRCWLWERGKIPQPRLLFVIVYFCDTIEEIDQLYSMFDAREAVKSLSDNVFSASNQYSLSFDSSLLKRFKFGNAVKTAYGLIFNKNVNRDSAAIYKAVNFFKTELQMLDKVEPTADRFPASIIMAALVTLKRYGQSGMDFWIRYSDGLGSRQFGQMDAVQSLQEALLLARGKKKASKKRADILELFARGINAFEGNRKDQMYERAVIAKPGKSLRSYLDSLAAQFPDEAA